MMISYAQNGEDVLLERAFAHQATGFYIDVGANHPVVCSVTKHFYDRGWRGINVEPAGVFQTLIADRPRDVNLNVALSNAPGTRTLYEFTDTDALSTLSAVEAEHHHRAGRRCIERLVGVRTLASICEEFVTGTIDFLSIDVEGHERAVLEGGDWSRWRPRVVLVEATRPNTSIPTHAGWEDILLEADYRFAQFDGLNRYYVRAEDAQLQIPLSVPVNVFDDVRPYAHVQHVHRLQAQIRVLRGQIAELKEQLQPWHVALVRRTSRALKRWSIMSQLRNGSGRRSRG